MVVVDEVQLMDQWEVMEEAVVEVDPLSHRVRPIQELVDLQRAVKEIMAVLEIQIVSIQLVEVAEVYPLLVMTG